jgi:anti-sigma regulatory factor (Ser/Thr protein kinase)
MTHRETDITPGDPTPSTHIPPAPTWQTLAEFILPSELESEHRALEKVTEAVQALTLPAMRLERLRTAVAEATLNAIEHGNRYRPDLPVVIRVLVSEKTLLVRVTDQGGGDPIVKPEKPNLGAKLAGQQSLRGWGFFLIEKTMDDTRITSDEAHHTIELFLYLEGSKYDD